MGPRVLGLAVTQLNFWVNVNLGSRIAAEGVVAALKLGFQLMLLPQGVFAQAIATVLFPSFSAQVARQERDALWEMLLSASGALFYLTLPATVGLVLLSKPIIRMFFMRGAFDVQAVAMVAWALAWYAIGLVAHSELEVITRAFYALHDTLTPVWVGGGAMALNVLLSVLFGWLFEWIGMGRPGYQPWVPLGGLALANSLATMIETLTLSWLLRRRLGSRGVGRLWASLWRVTLGSATMGGVLWVFLRLSPTHSAWIQGGSGILVGAGTFVLATLLLRSPEPAFVLSAVRRKIGL
jgi:putative peptidoglycan lipid II flippase